MIKSYINKVLKTGNEDRYIYNMNALMIAIVNNENGRYNSEINELIEKFPNMINEYDVYGFTPVVHAIQKNELEIAEKLIDKTELNSSFEAESLFMIAHSFCSDRILSIILNKVEYFIRFPFLTKDLSENISKQFVEKISKDMFLEENWTPLMICMLTNRKNICKALIEKNHNIHSVNILGHNAFDYCIDEEVGRLLYHMDSSPIVYFELYNHILQERHVIYSCLEPIVGDIAIDIMDYIV